MPALHRFDVTAVSSDYLLGVDDLIADPTTGLPVASWSKQGTVVNVVDVKYDFNVSGLLANDFGREQIYRATESIERYTAQAPITAEFRGLRTAAGAQAVMDRFALLFLQRWGYPPPILLCSVTFRRHLFEFLDSVRVSHPLIPNPITGQLGLDNELFEVLTVSPQFMDAQGRPNGRLDLALVWVGAIETSAVPVSSGSLSLIPGESNVDATDVPVGLASAVTLTTPGPAISQLRLGFKQERWREWACLSDYYVGAIDDSNNLTCVLRGPVWSNYAYNSAITYHIEYKTSTAPNAPGTGGDPSTGWVLLFPTTTRGNTDLYSVTSCTTNAFDYLSRPSPDYWTQFWTLPITAVYNVKVYYDTLIEAGDPCPTTEATCSTPQPTSLTAGCHDVYTGTSTVQGAGLTLTVDYIEGIAF